MTYRIVYTPSAKQDLRDIRQYIASQSSRSIATRFTAELLAFCLNLKIFPHRGVMRDAVPQKTRVIGFKQTVSVHFRVEDQTVTILAYTYAGRNWSNDYAG